MLTHDTVLPETPVTNAGVQRPLSYCRFCAWLRLEASNFQSVSVTPSTLQKILMLCAVVVSSTEISIPERRWGGGGRHCCLGFARGSNRHMSWFEQVSQWEEAPE